MNEQNLTYRVGSHLFHIQNQSSACISQVIPSLTPFICNPVEEEELLFDFCISSEASPANISPTPLQDISFEWEDAQCTILQLTPADYQIRVTPNDENKAYVMQSSDGFRRNTVYLPSAEQPTVGFALNNFLMMLYAFNGARRNTLLMHASVIAYKEHGYLFLGKSGTGKSTHTGLWLRYILGCHLLNDDNPVVRVDSEKKQAIVYGSPWSGKTPCYRNESMPVGAFVRLEQAPQNEIAREGTVRAFASLFPSCSCLKQDKEIYSNLLDTVTELSSITPVFHLKCLPDKAAAELCCSVVGSNKDPNKEVE